MALVLCAWLRYRDRLELKYDRRRFKHGSQASNCDRCCCCLSLPAPFTGCAGGTDQTCLGLPSSTHLTVTCSVSSPVRTQHDPSRVTRRPAQ